MAPGAIRFQSPSGDLVTETKSAVRKMLMTSGMFNSSTTNGRSILSVSLYVAGPPTGTPMSHLRAFGLGVFFHCIESDDSEVRR